MNMALDTMVKEAFLVRVVCACGVKYECGAKGITGPREHFDVAYFYFRWRTGDLGLRNPFSKIY